LSWSDLEPGSFSPALALLLLLSRVCITTDRDLMKKLT
jgi:hypothetical protein